MLLDNPPDVIPLTAAENERLAQLELVVETHLEAFLSVGRALAEIRNKRLYRQQHATKVRAGMAPVAQKPKAVRVQR
jgi:hypothetical protein